MNKSSSLFDVLKTNDSQIIKEYLMKNGKKQKPISPFVYLIKEKDEKEELK